MGKKEKKKIKKTMDCLKEDKVLLKLKESGERCSRPSVMKKHSHASAIPLKRD